MPILIIWIHNRFRIRYLYLIVFYSTTSLYPITLLVNCWTKTKGILSQFPYNYKHLTSGPINYNSEVTWPTPSEWISRNILFFFSTNYYPSLSFLHSFFSWYLLAFFSLKQCLQLAPSFPIDQTHLYVVPSTMTCFLLPKST